MTINNCSIFFARHGKLLLPYKNHGEMPYGVIADLASKKLNPPIDKKFSLGLIKIMSKIIPLEKIVKIYASPSKRCQETAALIENFIKKYFNNDVAIDTMFELKEIDFDLRKIYSLPDSDNFDIKKINNKVFEAMARGKNCELASDVYKRVDKIFSVLKEKDDTKKSLLITHDFFMRIIEIYINNKGKKKVLITHNKLKNTKRNGYLSGFATDEFLLKCFAFTVK